MLEIIVPGGEYWNEVTERYVYPDDTVLQLEHSLDSLARWESKWKKPFLINGNRPYNEFLDYVKYMTLNKVDPIVYTRLTKENIEEINSYMDDNMTAAVFSKSQKQGNRNVEFVTAETIYCWMINLNIPSEYQYWHLNRLMALITFCSMKNQTPKMKKPQDIYKENRALNAARRTKMGSKG